MQDTCPPPVHRWGWPASHWQPPPQPVDECIAQKMQRILYAAAAATAVFGTNVHIVHLMLDDWGYNNVGYHARTQDNAKEVVTPNIDALASAGVILDRFYAYRFCSPSRSSFLTGRNPIHVNTGNDALTLYNPKDQISGFSGIPRNMTAIAEKLASVGYNTVQAGKWVS